MGDYLTNHPHYIQGVIAERERIIALLESTDWLLSSVSDRIVVLIKGEI